MPDSSRKRLSKAVQTPVSTTQYLFLRRQERSKSAAFLEKGTWIAMWTGMAQTLSESIGGNWGGEEPALGLGVICLWPVGGCNTSVRKARSDYIWLPASGQPPNDGCFLWLLNIASTLNKTWFALCLVKKRLLSNTPSGCSSKWFLFHRVFSASTQKGRV